VSRDRLSGIKLDVRHLFCECSDGDLVVVQPLHADMLDLDECEPGFVVFFKNYQLAIDKIEPRFCQFNAAK
jgi:hypothetical protein